MINHSYKEEEWFYFLSNSKTKNTDIENIIINLFKIKHWNKYPDKSLKYKPDFKLSENIYLNVDGIYWHSLDNILDKKYHFKMRMDFENKNLRILQFRSNEVFDKLPIINSLINKSLNLYEREIDSEHLLAKDVSVEEAKFFLNQNDLKGYESARHMGLFFENELVFLISFQIKKYKKDKFVFFIKRFCSKLNVKINNYSKLFNKIESYQLPIYYWIDLRYEVGNFLLDYGFKIKREELRWEWVKNGKIFKPSKNKPAIEFDKLSKIYDAGQRLYIKDKK